MPVGLVAAFLAGVLSISSPCVLPLVPLYLA
ncbi:MAG: cytochrome c biogenesis protein CcdA, partial [Chloroflexota bacterium]|nr:cytochrome c biogenesis protein CcdA [Chloroflexota bacterium]